MYCNNCGAELEEGARFCVKCGAKIESLEMNVIERDDVQQESIEPDVANVLQPDEVENTQYERQVNQKQDEAKQEKRIHEKKKLSTKAKILIAVISVLIVLIGVSAGFCVYMTSPTVCIKGYANAIVGEKWDKVFQYTANQKQEEAFTTWAAQALTPIDSYTLEELNESDDQREFKVTFQDKDGNEIYTNSYVLKKQEENKLLLFPNWKLDDTLKVEQAVLQVPAGVQLFVDGSEIDVTTMEANAEGNISVTLQNVYAGPHSVKMTKQFYQDYENTIQITNQTVADGLPVLELSVSDSVVQDVCFEVVKGSQLLIDDVKVEREYRTSTEDGIDTYTIPFLEKGEHKVKVTKKYYDSYEETIQFDSSVTKSFVENQPIQKSEKWRVDYEEFLTALSHWDMDTIEAEYENVSGIVSQLRSDYTYQVSTLDIDGPIEFSLMYLNDDDIPEVLIDTGLYGYVITYYEDAIEFVCVSSDDISVEYRLGGERASYGFVLDEGLILNGGACTAASTILNVWKYDGGLGAQRKMCIYEDREEPDYSYINEEDVEQEVAEKKMEEYWNKVSTITTKLLNAGNIQSEIWGMEIGWESSIDPSVWLNAFINQWDEDMSLDVVHNVTFCDINMDGIPEIEVGYMGASNLAYLDKNMNLCWIPCDLCWILSDKTLIYSPYRFDASEEATYTEYHYDETTGIYQEQPKATAIETEEFEAMKDSPNIYDYKIIGEFDAEEMTTRLEELAKCAAASMGVTSDIKEAREQNALKSGADFEGIAMDEEVTEEDFKAYLDAYCENYTYMVTEKKFGYMQDYLYYGSKPSKGYDCVTEMQRMLGYDIIDSMTLTSAKIKDVTKVDDNTVRIHTVEQYNAFYNMSLERFEKNTKIYEQCKDKVSDDVEDYKVEVNIKQKVYYELKLDGNQWKFYRYIEGVDQTTEVVDCTPLS